MPDQKIAILQKVEILCALQKLGEKLSQEEVNFLTANMDNNMKQFELASTDIGKKKYFFYSSLSLSLCLCNYEINNKKKQETMYSMWPVQRFRKQITEQLEQRKQRTIFKTFIIQNKYFIH